MSFLNFKYLGKKFLAVQRFEKVLNFITSQRMSSHSVQFQEALRKVKSWQGGQKSIGNDVKLKMYAYFKQATEGPCKQPKPSLFDMVAKAKWDSWNSMASMTKDEAMEKYVSLVNEMSGTEEQSKTGNSVMQGEYDGLTYKVDGSITEIAFNRPEKKNAITKQMYLDIGAALREAAKNETVVTILTGKGDYFSSGNDLSNFSAVEEDFARAAKSAGELLRQFVATFIDFPKILVAAVNGPAVGIPVTLLGLCDVVYASEKATFYTPFSILGQSPEGCSTYTFPKIMGQSKANEILLFNKKFTAQEAKAMGLVSEVFPHETFQECVSERLAFLPSVSKQSILYSKELCRREEKETLHHVNRMECERLVERWQSQDCMEALMKFFQQKSKL